MLYLTGRLEQRLGAETAIAHLEAAVEADGELAAARIALAEARYDEGNTTAALASLDQVIEAHPGHRRARLWRAFLTSDQGDPGDALERVEAMQEGLDDHGAPTDRVLYQLTRVRLLRRQGNGEEAGEAVDLAG